MKQQLPWYRWHVRRYRHSARVLEMGLAAQGAYRNLLDAMWENGGQLPNAPAVLWRYALAQGAAEFEAVANEVLAMFSVSDDGKFLTNDTLCEELRDAEAHMEHIRQVRSEAGKKGNDKRWKKREIAKSQTVANGSQPIAHNSSKTAHDITKTKPAAEALPDLVQGFRLFVAGISEAAVSDLWSKCRQVVPDCSTEEVLELAERKLAVGSSGIRNPVGLLKACLTEWFDSGLVAQLRSARQRREAQQEEQRQREADQTKRVQREQAAEEKAERDLAEMEQSEPERFSALYQAAMSQLHLIPEMARMPRRLWDQQARTLIKGHLKGKPLPSEGDRQQSALAAVG